MSGVKDHFNVFPELGDPNYATSMLKHTTRQDKTAQVCVILIDIYNINIQVILTFFQLS